MYKEEVLGWARYGRMRYLRTVWSQGCGDADYALAPTELGSPGAVGACGREGPCRWMIA